MSYQNNQYKTINPFFYYDTQGENFSNNFKQNVDQLYIYQETKLV